MVKDRTPTRLAFDEARGPFGGNVETGASLVETVGNKNYAPSRPMLNISPPRQCAEEQFKSASAEAALFELRMRLLAGTIPTASGQPIDTNLSVVLNAILAHFQSTLKANESNLLKKACTVRNKLLHCEFSSARRNLDQLDPKPRSGGVTMLDISGLSRKDMATKISEALSGANVGQTPVANTNTKTLKDVVGWLLECYGAKEFEEAKTIFCQAVAVLDRLAEAACGKV